MAYGTFTISKIPASKVQQTIDLFKFQWNAPQPNVTEAPDGNALFKVTAVFEPRRDPISQSQRSDAIR
jgi:hypothetical protein